MIVRTTIQIDPSSGQNKRSLSRAPLATDPSESLLSQDLTDVWVKETFRCRTIRHLSSFLDPAGNLCG